MLKKLSLSYKSLLSKNILLTALGAVTLSFSSFLGYSSPLSAVICAYLPIPLALVFIFVTFITEIAIGINAFSLAAMFSALIVMLIRIVRERFDVKRNNFTYYLYPFISYISLAVVFLVAFSSGFADYLVAIVFSVLNFVTLIALKNSQTKYMSAFLYFMLIASTSGIDLVYINLGRALGIFCVLIIGIMSGAAYSCFAGIICSCAVAFYDPAMFSSTVFVCIVGIICSGGGVKDKLRIPLYAIAASIVCAVLSGAGRYEIGFAVDTLIAVIAFIFTEQKAVSFVSRYLPKSNDLSLISDILSSQVGTQLHSLSSLNSYLSSVSSAKSYTQINPIDAVYSGVCLNCKNHNACYKDTSFNIKTALNNCTNQAQLRTFAEDLKKKSDYSKKQNDLYQARLSEAMNLVGAVSEIVSHSLTMSDDIKNITPDLTKKLISSLKDNGAECIVACVYNDSSLYIEFQRHKRISEVRLCLLVSELMSVDYQMPEVTVLDKSVRYSFCPKPLFCADCGFAQKSAQENLCGDTFESITVGNKLYCILCDGMGTGKAASQSSRHLVSLLKNQLESDASSIDSILQLTSLIMRLTQQDESFSTLDLLSVDLMSGKLSFYKAGACESLVIGEGTTTVPSGGYPIGILNSPNIVFSELSTSSDCVIVMLTDGAKDISKPVIEKNVSEYRSFSSEDIAQNILKNLRFSQKNATNDDISAVVIKLEKRK